MGNLSNIDFSCIDSVISDSRDTIKNGIFDRYKNIQSIVIYKQADETIVIEDPCYDSNWSRGAIKKQENRTYTDDSVTLPAMVVYDNPRDLDKFIQGEKEAPHLKMQNTPQTIEVKFKADYDIDLLNLGMNEDLHALNGSDLGSILDQVLFHIKNAKKIIFQEEEYAVYSDISKVMFFGEVIWYKFVLMKSN